MTTIFYSTLCINVSKSLSWFCIDLQGLLKVGENEVSVLTSHVNGSRIRQVNTLYDLDCYPPKMHAYSFG